MEEREVLRNLRPKGLSQQKKKMVTNVGFYPKNEIAIKTLTC